ncbi:MAG: S-layer homology domain-containing protein [Candidatus Margulisiibacteriota bacterium]
MKKLFTTVAILLTVITLPAFAADVLDIGTSARSLGMGRAYVGISDVGECVFANPAGLYGLKKLELVSMYTDLSGDVKYTLVGVAAPTRFGKIGFGYASNKIGDIYATTIDATGRPTTLEPFSYGTDMFLIDYADRINKDLTYGLRFKYVTKGGSIASAGTGTGMNLDLGLQYRVNEDANAGMVIENSISGGPGAIRWNNGVEEEMPFVLNIGGSYRLSRFNTRIFSDISFRKTKSYELRLGGEWNAWRSLDLRAGLEQMNSSPTEKYLNYSLGVGYKFDSFRVDYAYYLDTLLSYNSRHYVSFAISLPEGPGRYSVEPVVVDTGDRVITTMESIVISGRANRSVEKVRCNNKLADVKDGEYRITVNLKSGKNKVILTGLDSSSRIVGSTEARVLRLNWYRDLGRYSWVAEPVMYMTTMGIQGFTLRDATSGFMRPAEAVSRLEMSAILARVKEMPAKKLSAPVSKDVTTLHWGSSYMKAALDNGWLTLFNDKTFRPARKVNRAEGVAIITRFAGVYPTMDLGGVKLYADVPLNYWGAGAIDAAKKAGYLDYVKGNKFVPGGNLTRAEVFYLLSKTNLIKEKVKYLLDFDKGY